ncbi:MAG TPA: LysM peptidoglycan-binding domain-containing protein [Anaerolineae bacterium]|nr:LysM peptidoglycan-binding domain-containing protein [Anaerolineae bacterium]
MKLKYFVSISVLTLLLLVIGFGVAAAETTYTVQNGDTLGGIANYYGTSITAIADANSLVNPNAIYVGQLLVIPDQTISQALSPQNNIQDGNFNYTVQQGDTLTAIAVRFGSTVAEIADANGLYNANAIYLGQVLSIPNVAAPDEAPAATATPAPDSPDQPAPTYQTHTVGYGDTLSAIASFYGVSLNDLMAVNEIANVNYIYIGQIINIPGTEASAPPAEEATPPVEEATPTPEGVWPTAVPTVGGDAGDNSADPTPLPTGVWPTATPLAGDAGDGGDSAENPTPAPTPIPTEVPLEQGTAGGENLLTNGGFEEGHYNQNGLAELQLPNHWRLEWKEGESGFDQPFFRPEVRVLSKAFIPPHEHDQFFYDGEFTVKVFKGYAPIDFSLLTDVELATGVYELTINIFPDLITEYVDGVKVYSPSPAAGDVRLLGAGQDSGWRYPSFGERNTITWRFRVSEAGTVTVGANLRGRYGLLNNGFFMDAWSLQKVEQ